jgi:hypothetical protein
MLLHLLLLTFRIPSNKRRKADEQSWEATSRLFNWHAGIEDGLWLDDGNATDAEAIRKLQQHPWIADPYAEDDRNVSAGDAKGSKLGEREILDWVAESLKHQATPGDEDACLQGSADGDVMIY